MQGFKFSIPVTLVLVGLSTFLLVKDDSKIVKFSPEQKTQSAIDTTIKKLVEVDTYEGHVVIDGVDNKVCFIPKPAKLEELFDSIEKISLEIEALEKTKPREPRKATQNRHCFNIDVDPREFPHLFCFNDILYEWDESRSTFADSLYRINWDDGKLTRGIGIDDYILTLIKKRQETKIFVFPVYNEKAFGPVMKMFEQKMTIYQAKLMVLLSRKENFEKEYNSLLSEWKRDLSKIHRKVGRKGREI